MFHVLLYYKIINIQHPEVLVKLHREVCSALQLKGRILIGEDGINGTVGGSKESIDLYKAYMNRHRTFANIDFKQSSSDVNPFPKLSVKARKEVITTNGRETFRLENTAKYVDRDTFHQWLVNGEDMVLVDMRNDYEWEIGRFVGAAKPPMKYFRDLKDTIAWYDAYKDKKVVTYCTGGIRCVPATAMLIAHGFDPQKIYQLEGGIVKYAEKYGNEGFYEGKCFVFDDRIAVPVNTTSGAAIVGNCLLCRAACDSYRNCANKFCNRLFIGCESCTATYGNTCGEECHTIIREPQNMRPPRGVYAQEHRNK